MKDAFSRLHPIVNFAWFTAVLVFSMVFIHPVMLGISLICAFAYSVYLTDGKEFRAGLKYLLPLMLLTALLNPLFSHEGATILWHFPDGNPLTEEAVLYGLASAVMLAGVIEWFRSFNRVISSDKFVYLFGCIIPALSLVLSMTLHFVPRFREQLKKVCDAQKCLGRDVSSGGILKRARLGLTILSVMVTWAFESSAETADSMRSRGYGLPGRTAFSIYRFGKRDAYALCFTLASAIYIIAAALNHGISWRYYPCVSGELSAPYTVSVFVVWLALCTLPIFLNVLEKLKWKSLISEN